MYYFDSTLRWTWGYFIYIIYYEIILLIIYGDYIRYSGDYYFGDYFTNKTFF